MTRQLSNASSLYDLKREARRWLHALENGSADAQDRYQRALADANDDRNGDADASLHDVQHALAREHGLSGWPELVAAVNRFEEAHLERIAIETPATLASPTTSPSLHRLLQAAALGDIDTAAQVLHADPVIVNDRGMLEGHIGLRTALHHAVGARQVEMVRFLLENGANPAVRDDGDDATPLHFAAEKGEMELIQLLVEHGADVEGAGTFHNLNVLGWSTVFGEGDRAVVDYLIAHGAQHTMPSAVAVGDTDAIRAIAAQLPSSLHARLDRASKQRTPLHLAVVKKQLGSLNTLLELGSDINATDRGGFTALDLASLANESAMVESLLRFDARVSLPAAVALNRADDIERILRAEPLLLMPGNMWDSLLVQASERASGEVISALLRHGAAVNAVASTAVAVDSTVGYTALHAAAWHGNSDAVRVLMNAGASVRAREERYCATPAGWAKYAGHPHVASIILEGDIDIFDAVEFTLVDRIAGIVARDPGALTRPFGEYVLCKVDPKVPWRIPTRTPLDSAREIGNADMIKVLEELVPRRAELNRQEVLDRFLRNACLDWRIGGGAQLRMARGTATRLLAQHPDIATVNIFTAVVCGEADVVRELLHGDSTLASQSGGVRNWPPLLYLAAARLEQPDTSEHAVTIARLLLDAGADANAYYEGGNPTIHYTALVCAVGMGEHQAATHVYARDLVNVLLEHGADPYDTQMLYEVFADHASRSRLNDDLVWLLEAIYQRSVSLGRGADWLDGDWKMLDMGGYGPGAYFLLNAAVSAGALRMTEWMLHHGANPNARAMHPRYAQKTVLDVARQAGNHAIVELLTRMGALASSTKTADETPRDSYDAFSAACSQLDRVVASAIALEHPEYLKIPRALFDAVADDQGDVVSLLLDLGVSPNISNPELGNGRALHTSAFAGAADAARILIARGAEVDVRETNYGSTPLGVAIWAERPAMAELIGQHSHDIFNLAFAGNVKRVRQLMQHYPELAKSIHPDNESVLMWLPDDEDAAIELARVLVAHGADPAFRDSRGMTAKRVAEQRALLKVVAVLEELMA